MSLKKQSKQFSSHHVIEFNTIVVKGCLAKGWTYLEIAEEFFSAKGIPNEVQDEIAKALLKRAKDHLTNDKPDKALERYEWVAGKQNLSEQLKNQVESGLLDVARCYLNKTEDHSHYKAFEIYQSITSKDYYSQNVKTKASSGKQAVYQKQLERAQDDLDNDKPDKALERYQWIITKTASSDTTRNTALVGKQAVYQKQLERAQDDLGNHKPDKAFQRCKWIVDKTNPDNQTRQQAISFVNQIAKYYFNQGKNKLAFDKHHWVKNLSLNLPNELTRQEAQSGQQHASDARQRSYRDIVSSFQPK